MSSNFYLETFDEPLFLAAKLTQAHEYPILYPLSPKDEEFGLAIICGASCHDLASKLLELAQAFRSNSAFKTPWEEGGFNRNRRGIDSPQDR